jgi:hypothetical protein
VAGSDYRPGKSLASPDTLFVFLAERGLVGGGGGVLVVVLGVAVLAQGVVPVGFEVIGDTVGCRGRPRGSGVGRARRGRGLFYVASPQGVSFAVSCLELALDVQSYFQGEGDDGLETCQTKIPKPPDAWPTPCKKRVFRHECG